jgi:RimJ/RimL family protein N-acetyltransferase
MEPVVLRTPRLVLSAHDERDLDDVIAYANDPDVVAGTPVPVPYGRDQAEAFLQDQVRRGWESGERLEFAVRPAAASRRLIGTISLFGFRDGTAEIGYAVHPDGRGRGYVTEAVGAVLDWAFAPDPDGLGLERVQWRALAFNHASAAVAQRLGFAFEGRRRSAAVHRGIRHDELTAAILRTDPRGVPTTWHR